MSSYKVGVIGGDGIGPEVTAEALKVVPAAGVALDTTEYDLGADRYIRTGEVLPDSVLEELRGHDAILLGAIGAPVGSTEVPPGTLERGMLLRLRFALDLYINLRPFTGVPGALAPDCDFVVIRENTEGTYAGEGGFLRKGTPFEVATQGSVNTRHGVERCARYAFALAATRDRAAPDPGAQDQRADLRRRPVAAHRRRGGPRLPGRDPGLQPHRRHLHLPGGGPGRYDVIVTDNLFGDIITDLAGAVAGGIGYAASANLNPDRTGPSMFEPVHGAANDIAGTGKANPAAAIRSAALMLDFLGETDAAAAVITAVTGFINYTPDPTLSTSEIGDAIAERL